MRSILEIPVVFIIFVLIISGCEQNQISDELKPNTLIITNNSDTNFIYAYSNDQILNIREYSVNGYQKTIFEYNKEDILVQMRTYDKAMNEYIYRFVYDEDERISEIHVFEIKNGIENEKEIKTLEYDSSGELAKINAILPETFNYIDSKEFIYGSVSENGLWVDETYVLDSKINPISTIGLPPIFPEAILDHNILSSTSSWDEYYDCMLENDPDCIEQKRFTELKYTSRFEYNEGDLPVVEYREYKERLDTLRYYYN